MWSWRISTFPKKEKLKERLHLYVHFDINRVRIQFKLKISIEFVLCSTYRPFPCESKVHNFITRVLSMVTVWYIVTFVHLFLGLVLCSTWRKAAVPLCGILLGKSMNNSSTLQVTMNLDHELLLAFHDWNFVRHVLFRACVTTQSAVQLFGNKIRRQVERRIAGVLQIGLT